MPCLCSICVDIFILLTSGIWVMWSRFILASTGEITQKSEICYTKPSFEVGLLCVWWLLPPYFISFSMLWRAKFKEIMMSFIIKLWLKVNFERCISCEIYSRGSFTSYCLSEYWFCRREDLSAIVVNFFYEASRYQIFLIKLSTIKRSLVSW